MHFNHNHNKAVDLHHILTLNNQVLPPQPFAKKTIHFGICIKKIDCTSVIITITKIASINKFNKRSKVNQYSIILNGINIASVDRLSPALPCNSKANVFCSINIMQSSFYLLSNTYIILKIYT